MSIVIGPFLGIVSAKFSTIFVGMAPDASVTPCSWHCIHGEARVVRSRPICKPVHLNADSESKSDLVLLIGRRTPTLLTWSFWTLSARNSATRSIFNGQDSVKFTSQVRLCYLIPFTRYVTYLVIREWDQVSGVALWPIEYVCHWNAPVFISLLQWIMGWVLWPPCIHF